MRSYEYNQVIAEIHPEPHLFEFVAGSIIWIARQWWYQHLGEPACAVWVKQAAAAASRSFLNEGIVDSMNMLELVMFVEEQFGANVEDQDIVPDNFDSANWRPTSAENCRWLFEPLVWPGEDMLVQDYLENSADRLPGKVGLICDGHWLTYAEIESRANRLANALKAHGVGRGEHVVVYLPNTVELVISIFATLKAGGVFVVVNHSTKHDKLAYIMNNFQARALITSGRQADVARQLAQEVASLQVTVLTSSAKPEPPRLLSFKVIQSDFPPQRLPKINIDLDLACLIYTSGSTGDPKGVMSDHSNVVFAASSIIEYRGNVESDIVIGLLPLSFDYGLYQLQMVFKFGGTLVLERGFTYPAAILKRIQEERVTGFPGVPTIYAVLLQMDLSPYDLSSVRYLTNTAAAGSYHPDSSKVPLGEALFDVWPRRDQANLVSAARSVRGAPRLWALPFLALKCGWKMRTAIGWGRTKWASWSSAGGTWCGAIRSPQRPAIALGLFPASVHATPATCSEWTTMAICTLWPARTTSSRAGAKKSRPKKLKMCSMA